MAKWYRTLFLYLLFPLCYAAGAAASLGYLEMPANSNAVAYDSKIKQLEKKEGLLWPTPFIATMPYGSKTYADALMAHNLSHTLKAYAKEDNNFILPLLNRSILNYSVGNQERAFKYLLNAKGVMESMNQKGFSLGAERSKIFKGESYEQAMACIYMGFLSYYRKDYQNARALFSQAIELDREIIPDPERLEKLAKSYASGNKGSSQSDLVDKYHAYGNDNRLAYYMLARTYRKLEDAQNTRISLANTGNWTEVPDFLKNISCGKPYLTHVNSYDTRPPAQNPFTEPEAFEQANVIILVQMGTAPEKRLGGFDGNKDMLTVPTYQPRKAEVYVDGQYLTDAYPMLNLMHQAACLSRSGKDTSQSGKAVGKFAVSLLAAVISDDLGRKVQNSWSVAADTRRWGTLPNEIHLVSAKLPEGLHTISVVFYDQAGHRLKHFEQIHHFVPAHENQETFLMVRALYDKFNTLAPFYASKVTKFDPKKSLMTFNPNDIGGVKVGQELEIITASYGDETENRAFMEKKRYRFISETVEGPRIRITKVGILKVTKLTKKTKAEGQLVADLPENEGLYFITKNRMVTDEILEVSNTYEK
jgi:tetratricopeptide (TPR) repeat protein